MVLKERRYNNHEKKREKREEKQRKKEETEERGKEEENREKTKKKKKKDMDADGQMSLLSMLEEKPSDEGEFLTSYVTDYRRVQDHGQ